MADMFPNELIDLRQQIDCIKRELNIRETFYPKWVAKQRMQQQQADYEIKAMNEVLRSLTHLDNLFVMIYQLPDKNWKTLCKPNFDDPFGGGILIVDAMRVLAMAYCSQEGATSSQEYLNRIKQGFDAEWKKHTTDIDFKGKQ